MAAGQRIERAVSADEAGKRLDVVVGRFPEVGSRSQGEALINAGNVRVDGLVRPRSFRVREGQTVMVALPASWGAGGCELEAQDIPVPVIYEDEWLLVVDKPAGLVVHPAKGHLSGTLVNALLGRGLAGGDEPTRPGIVHRLDKDTSGLMIVVRDKVVHRRMAAQIRAHEVRRVYLALVHGHPASTGTIEAPIGRNPRDRKAMAIGGVAAREAVTHFAVLERLGEYSLVEVRLETGRTHQIRVHFLAIGHPVCGDPVYGRRDPLSVGRQFLHSHRLAFAHPVTRDELDFVSPLPADLARVLTRLRAEHTKS